MSSTGGGERDDIDARFADIISRWDEPPSEARVQGDAARRRGDAPEGDDVDGRVDAVEDTENGIEPRRDGSEPGANAGPAPGPTGDLSDPQPAQRSPHGVNPPLHRQGEDSLDMEPPRDETPREEPPGWRVHEAPEDEDEGYDPPPPRPLPAFLDDWPFYLALVGLVGGPLWLIYLALFASTEHSLMWAAGGLTVAGFATLVLRQPRDRDDDGDDGARV